MGLFGALDVQDVKECPEKGTHPVTLRNIRSYHSQNDNDFIILEFIMDHPQFPDYKVEKWLRIYPDLDPSLLSDDEMGMVYKNVNAFRDWMRYIGVPEEEHEDPEFMEYTGITGMAYGYVADKFNGEGKEWKIHKFTMDNISYG